jgi:hypothetical protein
MLGIAASTLILGIEVLKTCKARIYFNWYLPSFQNIVNLKRSMSILKSMWYKVVVNRVSIVCSISLPYFNSPRRSLKTRYILLELEMSIRCP